MHKNHQTFHCDIPLSQKYNTFKKYSVHFQKTKKTKTFSFGFFSFHNFLIYNKILPCVMKIFDQSLEENINREKISSDHGFHLLEIFLILEYIFLRIHFVHQIFVIVKSD